MSYRNFFQNLKTSNDSTSNLILPKLDNAKTINVRMQGGAMGNLSKANLDGVEKDFRTLATEDKKLWAFNKEIGSYEYLLSTVKLNQVVILVVTEDGVVQEFVKNKTEFLPLLSDVIKEWKEKNEMVSSTNINATVC